LEFLEGCYDLDSFEKKCYDFGIQNKITDLKDAIKTYEDAGVK